MLSTLLLAACGGKKAEQKSAAELIADADHFQVDTIVATPDDTLVSTSVDAVLRHYPELYRAAEKAQQVYSKWALQEQQAKVCQTAMLDIRDILSATLGSETLHADTLPSLEQLAETTSHAYLRLISNAPAERKTAIGHSRKAFLAYAERLQQVAQAVPADLRERYSSIVARRLQKMQQHLQKSTTDN